MTHSQWINDLGWMWRLITTAEAEVCLDDLDDGSVDKGMGGKGKTATSRCRQKNAHLVSKLAEKDFDISTSQET
jgi:hypothetical protein